MEAVTMKEYGQVITGLINRENLTKEESKEMFMEILGDRQTPMQQGAFLAALSAKGPTAAEVAGSFEAIYEIDTCKVTPQTAVPVVENCGTGMDTFKTFNISTVAGIIAAADGVQAWLTGAHLCVRHHRRGGGPGRGCGLQRGRGKGQHRERGHRHL